MAIIMTMRKNKTPKTIMVLALIAAVSTSGVALANAETNGKNIIVELQKTSSPELLRMNEIVSLLDDPKLSTQEKSDLYEESKQIRHQAITKFSIDPIKVEKVQQAKQIMRDIMNQEIEISGVANIRDIVNAHGVGKGDQFTVYIDPQYFDEQYFSLIFDNLRNRLGDDIDITLKQVGKTIPASCSSQTGDCTPVEGGVQIESEQNAKCSVGFQAEDSSSNEGFVTAGHCGGTGSSYDEQYQPTKDFFGFNKVGDVTVDGLVDETTCDCLFVDADESISNKIFSNIAADQVGSIVYNDFMTTKGWNSTSFTGQIDDVSVDITYTGNIDVRDQFRVDETARKGDSGGPTYESGAQFPDLMGIVVAKDIGDTVSYHSKAANMDDELTGVSWNFS